MKEFLKSKLFLWSLAIIGILTAIIPIIGSLVNGILHVDEPILLVEMERIAEGYIPYIDMHLNYPPLWFYIMAGLKHLFHIPYGNYFFYHFIHYIFVIADAILIAGICRKNGFGRLVSRFSAWLFFIASHWMSGNAILFEMPSLFFGLLGLYLAQLQKPRVYMYMIIGLITSCSFLIKQFGAGFFILVLLVILLSEKHNWKNIVVYCVSYAIPIGICLLIWHEAFISSVFLNGYGTTNAVDGTSMTLFTWSNVVWVLKQLGWLVIRCFPILLAIPLLFFHKLDKDQRALFFIAIFGILGFLLQFLFVHWEIAGLLHYYLYIIPFACFVTSYLLDNYKKYCGWGKMLVICMLCATCLLSVYSTYYNRVWKIYINSNGMKGDVEFARSVASKVDEGSRVWIVDANKENIYWFANLLPPNMKTVGYSTGSLEITKERAQLQIDSADYVLHCLESDYCIPAFTDSMKIYLNQFKTDTFNNGGWTLLLHNTKIRK